MDNSEPVQVWGVGVRKVDPPTKGHDDFVVYVVGPEGEEVDVIRTKPLRESELNAATQINPVLLRDKMAVSEASVVEWLNTQARMAEAPWDAEGTTGARDPAAAWRFRRAAEIISTLRDDLEQAGVPDPEAPGFGGVSSAAAVPVAAAFGTAVRRAAEHEQRQAYDRALADAVTHQATEAETPLGLITEPEVVLCRIVHIGATRAAMRLETAPVEQVPEGWREGDLVQVLRPKIVHGSDAHATLHVDGSVTQFVEDVQGYEWQPDLRSAVVSPDDKVARVVAAYRAGPPDDAQYPDDEIVWLHSLLEQLGEAGEVPEATDPGKAKVWPDGTYRFVSGSTEVVDGRVVVSGKIVSTDHEETPEEIAAAWESSIPVGLVRQRDANRPQFGGYLGWVVAREIHPEPGDRTVTIPVHVNVPIDKLDGWGPMESVRVRLAEPPGATSEAAERGSDGFDEDDEGEGPAESLDADRVHLPRHRYGGRTWCERSDDCALEAHHHGECVEPDGTIIERVHSAADQRSYWRRTRHAFKEIGPYRAQCERCLRPHGNVLHQKAHGKVWVPLSVSYEDALRNYGRPL